jgi:hypothetical protein
MEWPEFERPLSVADPLRFRDVLSSDAAWERDLILIVENIRVTEGRIDVDAAWRVDGVPKNCLKWSGMAKVIEMRFPGGRHESTGIAADEAGQVCVRRVAGREAVIENVEGITGVVADEGGLVYAEVSVAVRICRGWSHTGDVVWIH